MHFDAVFNRQKTRTVTRSLETHILWLNRKMKFTKQFKNYPKVHSQTREDGHTIAPEYATGIMYAYYKMYYCYLTKRLETEK